MKRALVVVAVLLAPSETSADEPSSTTERLPMLILPAPRAVCKDVLPAPEGEFRFQLCRDLPPGRFLDAPAFDALELELKRLQTAETRLTAENSSLRKDASGWQPGWRTLALTLAAGFAGGVAAYRWLD